MPKGYLTTHVLDTATGRPAAGMEIELYRVDSNDRLKITEAVTNDDGRTETPILGVDDFEVGQYELIFLAGPYLDAQGVPPEALRFLDTIPIRFGISDPESHYHVPLLISPFGYSTYRGS